jgi:hypothetical protein
MPRGIVERCPQRSALARIDVQLKRQIDSLHFREEQRSARFDPGSLVNTATEDPVYAEGLGIEAVRVFSGWSRSRPGSRGDAWRERSLHYVRTCSSKALWSRSSFHGMLLARSICCLV